MTKFCNKPWREIHYYSSGEVGTCCREATGSHLLGHVSDDPLAIWRGMSFRKLRGVIEAGDVWEAGCGTCVDLSLDVVNECFEGESRESGMPQRVYFQLSYLCNMNCSHCSQAKARVSDPKVMQKFPLDCFKRIYGCFFPYALNWVFVGGEVLANPNFFALLDLMNPEDNPHCRLNIVTNGHLLRDALPSLQKFNKVNLHVSVDAASEETYRVVRGASWRMLLLNVRAYRAWAERCDLDWTMIFNFLLMRSNIHEVPEMIRLAMREDAEASFGLIFGHFRRENLFLYRELRDAVGWRKSLYEGIKLLEGMPEALWVVNALKSLRGVYHYLSLPCGSLEWSDHRVRRLWDQTVCGLNGCEYKEEYPVRKGVHLIRQGRWGHLARRVLEKVRG